MNAALSNLYLIGLSGELSVKGPATRRRFTARLEMNLRAALEAAGYACRFERRWSRLLLETDAPEAAALARRSFGVSWVARAVRRAYTSFDDLLAQGAEIFAPLVAGRSFAVRATRGDSGGKVPFRTPELERRLGALLFPVARKVDLDHPEFEARVELHDDHVYYFTDRIAGEGGLPIGTEGKAMSLVSGGFDSVVASWLLLRRGVKLDYFLAGLGGREHRGQVLAILRQLQQDWSPGSRARLFVADFRPLVAELELAAPATLRQILLKRHMVRAAAHFALRRKTKALATGESIGQVSSQTLTNLAVVEKASDLLLLRPLIGTGKEEIVALAKKIGSFEASSRVPEHCFLGVKNPTTAAWLADVEKAEAKLDPAIFDGVLRLAEKIDLTAAPEGEETAAGGEPLEVELPPDEVPLFDLRSPAVYAGWHPEGAINLPYPLALRALADGNFPALPALALVCELGYKSAHLAELLAARGVRAVSLKGGAGPLREKLADPLLAAALSPVLL